MFAKLIFITTIFTFVYTRNVQCCETQTSSSLDSLRSETDMNTHPTKTMEQKMVPEPKIQGNLQVGYHPTTGTPQRSDVLPGNHEFMHQFTKHPKKRMTKYNQDQLVDLRPGCCG